MTSTEALQNHLALCEELHQLTLEENRFLKQQQRTPDSSILERKRLLLGRLDTSLAALKELNSAPAAAAESSSSRHDPVRREAVEKSRAKILQILHLDRENEQLLLRHSLAVRPTRPDTLGTPPPAPPSSHIQRLYDRHA